MFAPSLRIELDKITHNARQLRALYGSKGIREGGLLCTAPAVASK